MRSGTYRQRWVSEQSVQSDRYDGESYHFQKMDDAAFYSARKGADFYAQMATLCPEAAAGAHRPAMPIGGGGS